MTMTKVYVDVEGLVRDWLKSLDAIEALVGPRVFFGIPANTAYPLITLRQVGGGPDSGNAPLTNALIQFDCWAAGQNKASAASVMTALLSALESLTAGTPFGSDATALGARTISVVWLPDPQSNQAKYSVTAQVTVRTNAA